MSESSVKPSTEQNQAVTSEYEELRARNIQRNNARLRALGLLSAREESESNSAALGYLSKIKEDHYSGEKRKHKRSNRQTDSPCTSPSRKSRRLQGLNAVTGEPNKDTDAITPDGNENLDLNSERMERVCECREVRQKAAIAFAKECGAFDAAAKKNPTATYDHALMRVQTMTGKGLANRVKAIERAAGKHCIIKMAIFKSCLQDEGLWDLADLASDALERLKGMQAMP
mmetsp:Transcript_18846/g.29185  ORF Transcript_18846/g.29185 Transcript_18846/m.29185 type:complete len:229 (-) Transcript_18846:278-964(-)|eukprot:CAMPEP_0196820158 /NCGR_PEP_ID=MMETSP1362-20130617/73896_1 /TAXON_ID=163516 /ORGANISM="Leptocylindrus danicus, Strain CCMP1856" /LENGTH=228 /DNA_ID=CAMNT_0042198927 /DNA_START=301 /DNA_END=987 /DNA_ORIENTATION=+